MPSKHTSGTTTHERPAFDGLREDIGEDPARFLCSDLNVWPLVRGFSDPQRASAWLAVARNVDADARVIDALEAVVERLREGSA